MCPGGGSDQKSASRRTSGSTFAGASGSGARRRTGRTRPNVAVPRAVTFPAAGAGSGSAIAGGGASMRAGFGDGVARNFESNRDGAVGAVSSDPVV